MTLRLWRQIVEVRMGAQNLCDFQNEKAIPYF